MDRDMERDVDIDVVMDVDVVMDIDHGKCCMRTAVDLMRFLIQSL